MIGSANELGMVDLSPKGDGAGFARSLDDKTLVIPDRPGDRRVDTFHNVLQKPGVGLIFLFPVSARRFALPGGPRLFTIRPKTLQTSVISAWFHSLAGEGRRRWIDC